MLIPTNIETSAASSFLFGQLHGRRCPPRTGRARRRRRWPRLARLDDRRWPDDHAPLLRQAHPPPSGRNHRARCWPVPSTSAAPRVFFLPLRLLLERPDAPAGLLRPRGTLLLLSVQSAAALLVGRRPKMHRRPVGGSTGGSPTRANARASSFTAAAPPPLPPVRISTRRTAAPRSSPAGAAPAAAPGAGP